MSPITHYVADHSLCRQSQIVSQITHDVADVTGHHRAIKNQVEIASSPPLCATRSGRCERSEAIHVTRAPEETVVISRDPIAALGTPSADCRAPFGRSQ